MKRLTRSLITLFMGLSLSTVMATADVAKGQTLYIEKIKPVCKMSGSSFAAKHSQDQWEKIYNSGKLNAEIQKLCGMSVDENSLPHIYDFAYEYANDSGNVPNF